MWVVPVVRDVVLDLVVGHVLQRRVQVLGVLDRGRDPVDAALEPADPQAGVAVEDPAEHVAPEHLAERRDVVHHPHEDAVVAARRGQRRLADVVRHREAALLDRLPHGVHGGRVVVDGLAVVAGAGLQRHPERREAELLHLGERPAAALAVPPVDDPDAVEAAVRALLQLGDVLVVDAEAELADLLVGPAHEPEQGVGERQLPVDAVGLELAEPRLGVVGGRRPPAGRTASGRR